MIVDINRDSIDIKGLTAQASGKMKNCSLINVIAVEQE